MLFLDVILVIFTEYNVHGLKHIFEYLFEPKNNKLLHRRLLQTILTKSGDNCFCVGNYGHHQSNVKVELYYSIII